MVSQGEESEHRPRENDHLVEPMYSGLGLNQEHCGPAQGGPRSESDAAEAEAKREAALESVGTHPGSIATRIRNLIQRWRKGLGL